MDSWGYHRTRERERYGLTPTGAPATEPVTLAEAKDQCRVDQGFAADDAKLTLLIKAAREYCEEVLGQALVTQTWTMYLDRFPAWQIDVPKSPLASVTSVKYYDAGTAALTTLSPTLYLVDVASKPGRITPIWAGFWPAAQARTNAVEIVFVAGVADAAVPARVKQAMLLLLGHWYENRESVVVGVVTSAVQLTVDALLMSAWAGYY